MAIAVYAVVVERAGETFSAFFPDLPGCTTAGDTIEETLTNAEQALSGHLLEMVRHGDAVPPPTPIMEIERDPDVDEVGRALVRVEAPGKSIRLQITMDEGLVAAIDKIAPNRSGFLAEAARHELARHRESIAA